MLRSEGRQWKVNLALHSICLSAGSLSFDFCVDLLLSLSFTLHVQIGGQCYTGSDVEAGIDFLQKRCLATLLHHRVVHSTDDPEDVD